MPVAKATQDKRSSGAVRPVFDWFTEGFDTNDLKEAQELLAELSQRIDLNLPTALRRIIRSRTMQSLIAK